MSLAIDAGLALLYIVLPSAARRHRSGPRWRLTLAAGSGGADGGGSIPRPRAVTLSLARWGRWVEPGQGCLHRLAG